MSCARPGSFKKRAPFGAHIRPAIKQIPGQSISYRKHGQVYRLNPKTESTFYRPVNFQLFLRDGLLQLAHFSFQGFHLLGLFCGDAAALTPVHFELLDPFILRLRRAPVFDEIDTIVVQQLSWCLASSNTICAARSTIPGEYLFVVFVMMLHPTLELVPPTNPVRFNIDDAEIFRR